MSMDTDPIRRFLHTQAACWNAGDKAGFLSAYREAAPAGLTIEYVGHPASDGWPVLDAMWARQNAAIAIEEVALIVNGNEAACHNRNLVRGTERAIETIELYRFDSEGRLAVRYFIARP
ncbi:nuclear transport factor 2 family protein [Massilia timonae]|uniref:nuclear transport factor 2 family protein n=1 Tax=Massilia timonae TaxID=47229 RepID=UPI0028A92640|nr:nuclear transport factor 2 family protein [Massilia timonae]